MAVFVGGHIVPFSFWRILTVNCNCNEGGTGEMQLHWWRNIFPHSQWQIYMISSIRNNCYLYRPRHFVLLVIWLYPTMNGNAKVTMLDWSLLHYSISNYCIRFHKKHQDPSKNQRHLICKRWLSLLGGTVSLFPFDGFLQWNAIAMKEAPVKFNRNDGGTLSLITNEKSIQFHG